LKTFGFNVTKDEIQILVAGTKAKGSLKLAKNDAGNLKFELFD